MLINWILQSYLKNAYCKEVFKAFYAVLKNARNMFQALEIKFNDNCLTSNGQWYLWLTPVKETQAVKLIDS